MSPHPVMSLHHERPLISIIEQIKRQILIAKVQIVPQSDEQSLVLFGSAISFPKGLQQPSDLHRSAFFETVIEACGQSVLLKQVVDALFCFAQSNENLFVC
jgi:hypothetical protein